MSDLPTRPRPGRGASRPSPAAFGLVRVGPDFEQEFPDADRSSTEAYASLVRTGVALTAELDRAILATFDVPHAVVTALAVVEGAGEPLTPSPTASCRASARWSGESSRGSPSASERSCFGCWRRSSPGHRYCRQ